MNKKRILLIVALFIVTVAFFVVWDLVVNYVSISFSYSGLMNDVVIYDSKDNKIETISKDGSVRLKKGSYYSRALSEDYVVSAPDFTADYNKQVALSLSYSRKYLDGLLTEQMSNDLDSLLNDKYNVLDKDYFIKNKLLLLDGSWCGITIENDIEKDPALQLPKEVYRVVLHKNGEKWETMSDPDRILTIYNSPNIPKEILDIVNNL
jgi:hypothetical protein